MIARNINTIVVGYDGSEHAEAAIDMAASVAELNDAKIIVVSAFPRMPRLTEPGEQDAEHIFEWREMADRAVQKLRALGRTAEPDVLEEPAADAILNAADARGADLIVVGCRGLGQFKELLLGSTSDRVIQYAKVPVLVVR